MELQKEIEASLKDALRSGDEVRKRTLRMVVSAIRFVEIDKGKPLDDAAVMAVLQKEVKSRLEAVEEARRAGRADLEAASQAEIRVLEVFLPKGLSPEELQQMAQQAVQETGATSPADMGKVMKVLMPRIQGRATGDQVSQAVRQLLQ